MMKNMNLGAEKVKEVRTQTLWQEFEALRMGDSESIDEYYGKLTIIVNKLRGLGNTVDHIQFSDLKMKSVDEIIGSLKAHEERLQGFGEKDETVLLKEMKCQQMGHFESECSTKDEQLNLIEMQKDEESSLLMIEACETKTTYDKEPDFVMLNETIVPPSANIGVENSWFLDTGANNHMSGERRVFRELDTSIIGKVCYGDNSVIDICGRGIVLFKCKTDEHLILSQVYYIPKLKSNILSLGQLDDESGNKIVIEDSVMKIYDRARSLIIMVTRQSNRLYVAKLKLADQVCLMTNTSNGGWL
ncbi:uncharacterized protein LOC111432622 [Cucurbita moschata]|uniref:Uncharacterized protein LOC111432622 n=1 Tax=Cucurbita moschata TaxID=3662 RepID=A0A6J1EBF9_CUCMO|nr:uncharacterized protein LOC111432622 [Cucurbita moschata]